MGVGNVLQVYTCCLSVVTQDVSVFALLWFVKHSVVTDLFSESVEKVAACVYGS